MRKIYILLLLLSFSLLSQGQQIGMFSHSFYKPLIFNPAFTGNGDATNAMLISRIQWIDFKNSPQLNIFTLDGPLRGKKMGLGLSLISDKKGISSKIGGNISYAYRLKLNEQTFLAFGVSAGIIDHSLNYSRAIVENVNDPVLSGDTQRETSIDANAGIALVWKDLEFGVAVPQLLGGAVEYQDNVSGRAYYSLARHYMGSLQYRFYINKEKGLALVPMGMVRFLPNAPFQYDGNLHFEWRDKFWIGATYKSEYAVSANAGFCISKQLYVGYSYDFVIGNIGKYSGMSHEIMLNFKFGKSKEKDATPAEENKIPAVQQHDPKVDSLESEIEIRENKIRANEQKIKELNEKLEQQKKAALQQTQQNSVQTVQPATQNQQSSQTQTSQSSSQNNGSATQSTQSPKNSENNNAAAIASNDNKTKDGDVWVVTSKTADFTNVKNHTPQKGFYVIVGTFFYRDFAQAEVQRFIDRGYKKTNWVFFSPKQYNYVFVSRVNTKEEALKKVMEMRAAGVKDAWIQILVE